MRCFIPSLLPALQESPPDGESSAAVNDEGDSRDFTTHCALKHTYTTSFEEEQPRTYNIPSHTYTGHMCAGDTY